MNWLLDVNILLIRHWKPTLTTKRFVNVASVVRSGASFGILIGAFRVNEKLAYVSTPTSGEKGIIDCRADRWNQRSD